MRKKFNDVGVCIKERHYMADTTVKLHTMLGYIEEGAYFAISRPRQYGKTTTLHNLFLHLNKRKEYLAIPLSFEGIGDTVFEKEATFCQSFVDDLAYRLENTHPEYADFLTQQIDSLTTFKKLSRLISRFAKRCPEKIVLLIDEIDKSSNNQIFLSFLGMLRDKYLEASKSLDATFHSVILAGVHDIKSLKIKIAADSKGILNSPWNIAIDFRVDMRLNESEIESMLLDYQRDRKMEMDTSLLAQRIFYYTAGYPYLVSKISKIVDEELLPTSNNTTWSIDFIDTAFRYLVEEDYTTTLFDDLTKNLENTPALYAMVFDIVFNGQKVGYNILNPTINLGILYGVFRNNKGQCRIHNRVFEQKIYAYMLSKEGAKSNPLAGVVISRFFKGNILDIQEILIGFQQFMKENYSSKDSKFLEREGRLLFLSYLKPIINGKGFDFKEPTVSEERRMDVVVTYDTQRYVIELKRWEGASYHKKGLQQLSAYLDTYHLKQGFLLIFDFRKSKRYKTEMIMVGEKRIFACWV